LPRGRICEEIILSQVVMPAVICIICFSGIALHLMHPKELAEIPDIHFRHGFDFCLMVL